MEDKIFRHHYRGHLNTGVSFDLKQIINDTKQTIRQYISKEKIMTACIYEYENMLFAYYESIGEEIKLIDFCSLFLLPVEMARGKLHA